MTAPFICWEPTRTHQVLNIEAEKIEDAIFMATHSPYPLDRVTINPAVRQDWNAIARRSQQPEAFLEEFLDPNRDHAQGVVLGGVGSGKSHLIQWLRLSIPASDTRHILTIPRAGTSLRGILSLLIDVLPSELQESYNRRLREAPVSAVSREQLEQQVLNALVQALYPDPADDELNRALLPGLRDFLLDPAMRDFHVGTGGIISELAQHASEPTQFEAREARRAFERTDLHIDAATRHLSNFAAPTRVFLKELISKEDYQDRCIRLMNSRIETAMTSVLGFTGDQLIELMREIRVYLHGQGKELILLFEDFARAEGIDRALLDALMERAGGGTNLCRIRWAMAITSAYFDDVLLDTHKARMDFVINMDLRRTGTGALITDDEMVLFTARYANALRVPAAQLNDWYDRFQEGDRSPPPNACESCPVQDDCHAAFGSVRNHEAQQLGIYPLTRDALINMTARQGLAEQFNPRTLLNRIMAPIFDHLRADDLAAARFPDKSLVDQFGGGKLPATIQASVRSQRADNADQYLALLDLWTRDPEAPTNISDAIYAGFGLTPIRVDALPDTETPPDDREGDGAHPPPPIATAPQLPKKLAEQLQHVNHWANQQGNLPQATARELRNSIFAAILSRIDWDAERLGRSSLASTGAGSPFRPNGLRIERQETPGQPAQVSIRLPLNDTPEEQLRTAIAFQAILLFEHHGTWDYKDGGQHFLALSACLEAWSEAVLDGIASLHDPEGEWNAVNSAVELLAIGAALASRPPASTATAVERLDAIFGEWPDPAELRERAPTWTRLYTNIYRRREMLVELVRSRTSGGKGGQVGDFIDAAAIIPSLRQLAGNWQPRAVPPERLNDIELREPFSILRDLHHEVCEALPTAVRDEVTRRAEWLQELRTHMPEGTSRADVVEAISTVRKAMADHGIPIHALLRNRLDERLDAFKGVQLDEAVRIADEISKLDDPVAELPRVAGERRAQAMVESRAFFPVAVEFLDAVESSVESTLGTVTGIEAQSQEDMQRIEAAFQDIAHALQTLGGSHE